MKTKITFYASILLLSFGSMFLAKCKKDKCKNTICQNGGTCVDGTCNCPDGYTGTKCESQKTPSNLTLTQITVTNICVSCDPDENYPDIFVQLWDGGTKIYDAPTYYSDVAYSSGSWSWSMTLNLDPSKTYTMKLVDYDPVTDDVIHSCSFSPYSSSGGFPSTKSHTCGSFSFTNDLTYSW